MKRTMQTLHQSQAKEASADRPILTKVLIPLGSFLAAGLGLLNKELPEWVLVAIVLYMVVVAIVAVAPTGAGLLRRLKKASRHRAIARQYLPGMRRFMTVLSPNFEDARSDTVYQIWRSASSHDKGQRLIRVDYLHLRTVQSWFESIEVRLERVSGVQFKELAEEFSQLVSQYNRLCEEAQRQIEQLLAVSTTIEPQQVRAIKQDWNNTRDKHIHTIKEWEDMAKNINHDLGEPVCSDYYPMLKTLQ